MKFDASKLKKQLKRIAISEYGHTNYPTETDRVCEAKACGQMEAFLDMAMSGDRDYVQKRYNDIMSEDV